MSSHSFDMNDKIQHYDLSNLYIVSSALSDFSVDSSTVPSRDCSLLIYALVWLLHLSISRSSYFINLVFALRGRRDMLKGSVVKL